MSKLFRRRFFIAIGLLSLIITKVGDLFLTLLWRVVTLDVIWNLIAVAVVFRILVWMYSTAVRNGRRLGDFFRRL